MTEPKMVTPLWKQGDGGRPWLCRKADDTCTRTKPCPSCRGRRNRRKGQEKQARNLKALESVAGVQAQWAGRRSNEETATHLPVIYENKAGASGGANAIWKHYLRAETQALASKAIGDARPFLATFSPDGTTEGLAVMRISLLPQIVEAIAFSANRDAGDER